MLIHEAGKEESWTDDTEGWTNMKDYSKLKRNAENRTYWKDLACLLSTKEVTSD